MSRKNKNKRAVRKNLSLQEIGQKKQELDILERLTIEKALKSNEPRDILKAQEYINGLNRKNRKPQNAFLFDPFDAYSTGSGYKRRINKVGFEVLKKVREIPLAKAVHNTRIFQIQNFLKFTSDDQKEGFTIKRKIGRFEDNRGKEISKEDQQIIEYIADFLENSRMPVKMNKNSKFNPAKWDEFDDFDDFVRMIMNDSLTFDQLAVENIRTRGGDLYQYKAIDASTIRLLDTIDPRYRLKGEKKYQYDEINGILPRYGQVWGSEIQKNPVTGEPIVFYPWELAFEIRNKNTDIHKCQYGLSELEVLIDNITWILYGMQYNGNFFKNGSNPKGFINIKDNAGSGNLDEFRQTWKAMLTGAGNEHRMPIFEGLDVNWVSMQTNNRDMEFNQWLEFLIVMFCSVYTIDPSELGYHFKNYQQMFGQSGQKERLDHSKEKGLKPLLMFLEKVINKNIVSEINPEFEFVFTGIDLEDIETMLANDKMKVEMGAMSLEDLFEKYNDRELTDKDTILNSIAFQYKQAGQYGGQESNAAVDEMAGGEDVGPTNPFDQYEKAAESDPIMKASMDYLDKQFNIEK